MQSFLKAWNQFWFESFDEKKFRLFQVIFLLTIFVLYGFRLLDYEFLYSESGILPFSILQDVLTPGFTQSILPLEFLAQNSVLGFSLHVLLLVLIAFTLLYRQIWFVTLFIYILHIIFLRRNPISIYGVDMVATCWFLYMSFVHPKAKSIAWQGFNSVMYRLIQIQLCIIYAYSGFDKMRGLTWWRGDAIWYALGNTQITTVDFSFLAYTPALLSLMAYVTVIWESYFPLLIWVPQIRRYVLCIGMIMHMAIATMMNLYEFSLVMMSAYPLFFDKNLTAKWYQWLQNKSYIRLFFR